jgi:MinD-like ATPase involved in chromosome partitioning or flagellar assembly
VVQPINQTSSISANVYQPAGRLVPVLSANPVGDEIIDTAIALSRKAASYGETVLVLDCTGGYTLHRAGVIYQKTLADVLKGEAELRDALYVTSNEHYNAAELGDIPMDQALGSLAALSLDFDWVFVVVKPGCTGAHVRLAAVGDACLLGYDTSGDAFMRAYWTIEAVRRRAPKFDPLILSCGNHVESVETALMLSDIVRGHLGAPPPYAGHTSDAHMDVRLLSRLREAIAQNAA